VYFSRFWAATRISRVNCAKMAGGKPIDNLRTKLSALNVDFSGLSPDLLGSRRPAHAGVKEGYPSKKWLFFAIGLSNVKMVPDRYRHAVYHNKQW